MKKILFVFVSVFTVVGVLMAANPAKMTANNSVVKQEVVPATTYEGSDDSLNGTSDSIFVKRSLFPEYGYEYVLQYNTASGGGSDSMQGLLYVYGKYDNGSGTNSVIRTMFVDTLDDSTGEAFLLPIGQTVFGNNYDIKIKSGAANGGILDFSGISIWKRRLRDFVKNDD